MTDMFDWVQLYELETTHAPIDQAKVNWVKRNMLSEKSIPVATGEDRAIHVLSTKALYSEQGATHVIIPEKLTVRRFANVSLTDLEIWQNESTNEINNETQIVMAGEIPKGIAPVREILEAVSPADKFLHPITSDRDEFFRKLAAESPPYPGLMTLDEYSRYNYTESFKALQPCQHFECPICYGELHIFPTPQWFIPGLSEDAKEVKDLRLRMGKLKELETMKTFLDAIQLINLTWEVLDLSRGDDDASKEYYHALAISELEKEEEEAN